MQAAVSASHLPACMRACVSACVSVYLFAFLLACVEEISTHPLYQLVMARVANFLIDHRNSTSNATITILPPQYHIAMRYHTGATTHRYLLVATGATSATSTTSATSATSVGPRGPWLESESELLRLLPVFNVTDVGMHPSR